MNWEVCTAPMCRACMKIDGTFVSMDDVDSIKPNLLMKLADIASIRIDINDGLPMMLCTECAHHTNLFYNFKRNVKESEEKLRRMFDMTSDFMKDNTNECVSDKTEKYLNLPSQDIFNVINRNIIEESVAKVLQTPDDILGSDTEEICVGNTNIDLSENRKNNEERYLYGSRRQQYTIPCIPDKTMNSVLDEDNFQDVLNNSVINLENIIDGSSGQIQESNELQTQDTQEGKRERYSKLDAKKNIKSTRNFTTDKNINRISNYDSEDSDSGSLIGLNDNIIGSLNDAVTRIKEIRMGPDKIEYQCTLCLHNYSELSRVLIHIVDTHVPSTGPFFCIVCEKDCESRRELRSHVKIHTGSFPYTCFICNKNYATKRYLKRHMLCHTDFPKYRCLKCGLRYKVKSELEGHLATHTHRPAFKCDQCPRVFNHKGNYKRHLMSHLDPLSLHLPKFPCDQCGKRFLNNRNLITHMRVHTGERPYKCDLCDKRFSQRGNLLNHSKSVHSNPRSYTCDICSKSFNQKATLRDHRLLHTGEKPHVCTICGIAFTFSSAMRRHMWTHSSGKPFGCDICQARFIGKYDLKRHMKIHSQHLITSEKANLNGEQDVATHGELMEEMILLEDTQDSGDIFIQPILEEDSSVINLEKDSEKENNDAIFSLIPYS